MSRLPRPAQYLLRVDDLCPTVHAQRWARLVQLIREFGIRPILAIVPENQDPELDASPADPQFWTQVRNLERTGAAIALHGLNHVCNATGRSLVPLHRTSEFAGAGLDLQHRRIARGLDLLRQHGLDPKLFVAPRHGFDANTLLALRDNGLSILSDGLARVPFLRGGVQWIPMQLWSPVLNKRGLWTICVHPNTTDDAQLAVLRRFLDCHAAHFTSLHQVLAQFEPLPLRIFEGAYEIRAKARLYLRQQIRRLRTWEGPLQPVSCRPDAVETNSPAIACDTALPSDPARLPD